MLCVAIGPPGLGVASFFLPGFSAPLEVRRWHAGRGGVALRASPQQDAPIISCKFGQLQSCQDSDTEARGSHAPGSVFRLHCIARNLSAEVTFFGDLPYGGFTCELFWSHSKFAGVMVWNIQAAKAMKQLS